MAHSLEFCVIQKKLQVNGKAVKSVVHKFEFYSLGLCFDVSVLFFF